MEMETSEGYVTATDAAKNEEDRKKTVRAGVYVFGMSCLTAAIAGIVTTRVAKKEGQKYLKHLEKESKVVMETPTHLALRAFAWSTVLSVSCVSLVVFGVCKYYNIKSLDDIRALKKRSIKTDSDERTEFDSIKDFLNYISDKSKEKSVSKNT